MADDRQDRDPGDPRDVRDERRPSDPRDEQLDPVFLRKVVFAVGPVRVTRWRLLTLTIVAMFIALMITVLIAKHQSDVEATKRAREEVVRRYEACLNANEQARETNAQLAAFNAAVEATFKAALRQGLAVAFPDQSDQAGVEQVLAAYDAEVHARLATPPRMPMRVCTKPDFPVEPAPLPAPPQPPTTTAGPTTTTGTRTTSTTSAARPTTTTAAAPATTTTVTTTTTAQLARPRCRFGVLPNGKCRRHSRPPPRS